MNTDDCMVAAELQAWDVKKLELKKRRKVVRISGHSESKQKHKVMITRHGQLRK